MGNPPRDGERELHHLAFACNLASGRASGPARSLRARFSHLPELVSGVAGMDRAARVAKTI